jgi:hypothetical protein
MRPADLCLCAATALAALALLLGFPAPPMILAAAAALALWDRLTAGPYRGLRLGSILVAIGGGTAAALAGRALYLRLPFLVMMLCVLAAAYGLDRARRALRSRD